MIIENSHPNEVTMSSGLQTGTFTIKESAKAFQILSNSLYRNKIRSIIRELSCNARDSRVGAGLSEDFTVHLPTRFEPEFCVKDEGLGLTHSEVMNLYTTYFESTKNTSNLFVGALGLGSKSPFSYTENFTVTAIKDGTRGIYSAFINEQGVPSIVCLFSGPTEDKNGVEVKFAVPEKDHSEFSKEAQHVFTWFVIKPECNIALNGYYYGVPKENVYTHHSENTSGKSIVLMGGVAYEFDLSDFVVNPPNTKFLFRVNIGDVDNLPSREGLQNTAKTKAAILSQFNKVIENETSDINTEYSACSSTYSKLAYLNTTSSALSVYCREKLKLSANFASQHINIVDLDKVGLGLKCSVYSHRIGKKGMRPVTHDRIAPSTYVKFVYNDINASLTSIKDSLSEYSSTVYIFTRLDKEDTTDFNAFKDAILLGAEVRVASDFVVKTTRTSVSKRNTGGMLMAVAKFKKYQYSDNNYKLENYDGDLGGVKYYVRLDSANKIVISSGQVSLNSVVDLVGHRNIVFLKKTSKADVSSLIEFSTYVDSLITVEPKYKFPSFSYRLNDLQDIVEMISKHSLVVDDAELNMLSLEYKLFTRYNATNEKIRSFTRSNPVSYPDNRIPYDSDKLDELAKKYGIITPDSSSPKLLQLLINTIHNYESAP